MAKKTTCVKIKTEFVVEFDEPFDSIPIFLKGDAINRFFVAGLRQLQFDHDKASVKSGGKFSMSMHWPKN